MPVLPACLSAVCCFFASCMQRFNRRQRPLPNYPSPNTMSVDSLERPLTCGVCKLCRFYRAEELENHEKVCDGLYKEIFTCDVCQVAHFDTMEEAIEHENQCRDENSPSSVCESDAADMNLSVKKGQSEQQGSVIFVTIPPGRIGLALKLNRELGGAIVTGIDATSTTEGKVDVGDRIISIDNHKIVSTADYTINQGKIRILQVAKTKSHQEKIDLKSLRHLLFSSDCVDQNEAMDLNVQSNSNTNITASVERVASKNSSLNLHPAQIPFDPLDETFDYSLERELAWLIEESAIILPTLTQHSTMSQPFLLDFAWRHGSFGLRLAIDETYPYAISDIMKNMKIEMTDQEIREKYCGDDCVVVDADLLQLDREQIQRLRGVVHSAIFNIGFRRSHFIERELNAILSARIGDALGEIVINKLSMQQRRRRKRLLNDNLISTTDDVNRSLCLTAKAVEEVARIATNVPIELSTLEDEVAFLAEESLMLLPESILASSSDNLPQTTITTVVSAGLSTQHDDEIDWRYVCANASEDLKQVLDKIDKKRRPLQRIIRHHDMEVRVAFERRRLEICKLLVLDGYRREQTCANLPSNDLLEVVGLLNVLKVRLKHRLHSCGSSQAIASKNDLRTACNIRCEKRRRHKKEPKKKPALDFTNIAPGRYSILNATERELAFLREEFEAKYGHRCFDWDYIEKRCSPQLRLTMTEKRVTPLSQNPSVEGESKLLKLVRLNSSDEIKQAFTELRRDIRYALGVGFKRDLRRDDLPDLPPAPALCVEGGDNVIDIEYPRDSGLSLSDEMNENFLLRGVWNADEEWNVELKDIPSAIAAEFQDANSAIGMDTEYVLDEEYSTFSDVMSLDKSEMIMTYQVFLLNQEKNPSWNELS